MANNLFIIDDDEEILNLLQLALAKSGFDIKTAKNHKEAMEAINRGYRPDVILMDYYLPELDGISISKEFLAKGLNTPILLFTAADNDVINLFDCPNNIIDIIRKPFSFDEITEKIKKILRLTRFCIYRDINREDLSPVKVSITDKIYTEKALGLKTFFNRISHNMKNSLQSITNYVELLKKGYIDKEDEERVYSTILKKVNEIKHELDILKRPSEFYCEENFSMKGAIRTAISEHKKEIKKKDIYIKTDFQKGLPLYYGRRGLFIEVFSALLKKIIDCSEKSSKIEIVINQHQQEYVIEINQDKIDPNCDNLTSFFDLNLKDEDSLSFTKAVLSLKDMAGKIQIDTDRDGKSYYKIVLPMRINVSDRD